jgi:hypothetical protein
MHDSGYKTWVSIEPYPTPNVVEQDLMSLLNAVSFVDRIVFGRWHYNKVISGYKKAKSFYNTCAQQVLVFCKEHNIACHIKTGTLTAE